MTIPAQITIASKHGVKHRRKDVAESVSEYQSDFEVNSTFSSKNPNSSKNFHRTRSLRLFSLESSSNYTPSKDYPEDDFPTRGRQLSKPKEANLRGNQFYSPVSSSSSSTPTPVVSNPFVGSIPFTPSMFLFF